MRVTYRIHTDDRLYGHVVVHLDMGGPAHQEIRYQKIPLPWLGRLFLRRRIRWAKARALKRAWLAYKESNGFRTRKDYGYKPGHRGGGSRPL